AGPGDAVDDKLDRPERKAVADLRLMVQMGGKPVRERHCGVVGRDGETVNFTKRAKRDVARNEEITEQAHIGGGRRRHVDEKSVKCSRLLRRSQKIRIVALPNSVGLSRSENMPVAHHQRELCPGRDEAATQIGIFRTDRITDQLVLKLARQVELDAPW